MTVRRHCVTCENEKVDEDGIQRRIDNYLKPLMIRCQLAVEKLFEFNRLLFATVTIICHFMMHAKLALLFKIWTIMTFSRK